MPGVMQTEKNWFTISNCFDNYVPIWPLAALAEAFAIAKLLSLARIAMLALSLACLDILLLFFFLFCLFHFHSLLFIILSIYLFPLLRHYSSHTNIHGP